MVKALILCGICIVIKGSFNAPASPIFGYHAPGVRMILQYQRVADCTMHERTRLARPWHFKPRPATALLVHQSAPISRLL